MVSSAGMEFNVEKLVNLLGKLFLVSHEIQGLSKNPRIHKKIAKVSVSMQLEREQGSQDIRVEHRLKTMRIKSCIGINYGGKLRLEDRNEINSGSSEL